MQDKPPDLLGPIIKPFTELIIQIDKKVIRSYEIKTSFINKRSSLFLGP